MEVLSRGGLVLPPSWLLLVLRRPLWWQNVSKEDYEYYNKALHPTVCNSSWVNVYKDFLDILQQYNAPSLKVIISHDN